MTMLRKQALRLVQANGLVLSAICCVSAAQAACIAPSSKLTPAQVEAQFCAADAVFTGEVESVTRVDEFDSKRVSSYQARSKVRLLKSYKGISAETATMVATVKEPEVEYFFKNGKQYLIFAHKLNANEYASATAKCSAQYAVEIAQADNVLKRLEQDANGARKIKCSEKPVPAQNSAAPAAMGKKPQPK